MLKSNWLTTVATALCAGIAVCLLTLTGCSKAPDPEAEAAAAEAAEAAAEAAAIAAMPVVPALPQPEWQKHIDDLQPAVENWAAAWSAQDVDSYLAHYAPYFAPPDQTRSAWEAQRRDRLTRPKRIDVRLDEISRVGVRKGLLGGRNIEFVKVRFHQTYESNTFSDEVDKVLELEYLDGGWKIATEKAL